MDINKTVLEPFSFNYRRLGLTFFSSIFMAALSLSLSPKPAVAARYQIDSFYTGPLCLNLGRFSGARTVRVEWGTWLGQNTIEGDANNNRFVSLWAYGNNIPVFYIHGLENAELLPTDCAQFIQNNDLDSVQILNWFQR